MAQHGYLPEYDDAPDRSGDRDRWRDEDRERDRNFMFGDRDRERQDGGGRFRDREPEDFPLGRERSRRDFRSSMDHHYASWRDRQMQDLDRDYDDYCREREQQFHSDFDEWRRRRHGNPQPLRTGMTQTGMSHDPSGELELTEDQQAQPTGGSDPMATATLGNEGGSER